MASLGGIEPGNASITRSSIVRNGFLFDRDGTIPGVAASAIFNSGTLTVTDSSVSENVTDDDPVAISNVGGTVTLVRTLVSDNSNGQTVIYSSGGTLTILDSAVSGNVIGSGWHGCTGGRIIYSSGVLLVINSTVSHNGVCGEPGGNGSIIEGDGSGTVIDSTVSGNTSRTLLGDWSGVLRCPEARQVCLT